MGHASTCTPLLCAASVLAAQMGPHHQAADSLLYPPVTRLGATPSSGPPACPPIYLSSGVCLTSSSLSSASRRQRERMSPTAGPPSTRTISAVEPPSSETGSTCDTRVVKARSAPADADDEIPTAGGVLETGDADQRRVFRFHYSLTPYGCTAWVLGAVGRLARWHAHILSRAQACMLTKPCR